MEKIRLIIVSHWQIICIALVIGLISSLPQYLGQPSRPGFEGVYTGAIVKDTVFYQARIKDVIDGHPFVTNPYLAEHKSGAPMQFWIPDYILAKPIGWLNLSVPSGYIIWTFLLTAILVLVSYAVLLVITESKRWSILGVLFLHVGFFALKFIRLPPHGLNFIFWLVTLLCLLLFINRGNKKYAIGSALSFGMLFNIYPYYWTFYVVVFVVFIALCLLFQIKDVPYKKYALIFGGGLLVGIPYFVSVYMSSHLPGYAESLERLGVIHTRFPSGISTVVIGLLVVTFFIFSYRKKIIDINPLSVFMFAGTLSGIIVMNQHLITGRNGEFSSHYSVGNMFWFTFSILYILNQWLKSRSEKIQKIVFALCCVLVIIVAFRGAQKLINQQIAYQEREVYVQDYRPLFDWLNQNAQPEDVVFTNEEIGVYIPIYTKQNVFYSGYSILFFMTDDEVENRFIINNYFEKFTDEFVVEKQRGIFGGYYVNEYGHNASKNKLRKLLGQETQVYVLVPPSQVEHIKAKAKTIQKDSFEKVLGTYRADYILWDKIANPNWKVENQKFLKEVYQSGNFTIYQVIPH